MAMDNKPTHTGGKRPTLICSPPVRHLTQLSVIKTFIPLGDEEGKVNTLTLISASRFSPSTGYWDVNPLPRMSVLHVTS